MPAEQSHRLVVPKVYAADKSGFLLVEHMIRRDVDDVEADVNERLSSLLRTVEIRIARISELRSAERGLLIYELQIGCIHKILDIDIHIVEIVVLAVSRAILRVDEHIFVYDVVACREKFDSNLVRRLRIRFSIACIRGRGFVRIRFGCTRFGAVGVSLRAARKVVLGNTGRKDARRVRVGRVDIVCIAVLRTAAADKQY